MSITELNRDIHTFMVLMAVLTRPGLDLIGKHGLSIYEAQYLRGTVFMRHGIYEPQYLRGTAQ